MTVPKPATTQQAKRKAAKLLVRGLFKNDDDQPFELSDGQADIFNAIVYKQHRRTQIIAPTQYGKSSTIAMALNVRAKLYREQWAIVTGQQSKSMIIMEKVIQHAFDHPMFYNALDLDPSERLDRLKRHRTKEHITWSTGGGIRTFTADSKNRQRVKESLAGFGSPNIIEDEASLIPNDLQAMVLRMLGGHQGGYLYKIGNPFYRNHFYNTWHKDDYQKIFIDYHQGLAEDRYTDAFIDEMRDEPFFDVLYDCKFPDSQAVLDGGYRRIITPEEVEEATVSSELQPIGQARLGGDIGRGRNYSVFVVRWDNFAKVIDMNRDPDLMSQVARVEQYMDLYNVSGDRVFVDDVGVGGGVSDRLREKDIDVTAVKEGATANNKARYANLRAEMFWEAANWLKAGGRILQHEDLSQLAEIHYKEDSASRLKIEPKADMAKRGVPSPDVADAFSLTFAQAETLDERDYAFL